MIDHVSIGVRDLAASTRFYEEVLATLSHTKLVARSDTVGFGKKYAEFWLNSRPGRATHADLGDHVCLRASSREAVHAFHASALQNGAEDEGAPGFREHYLPSYYAAFIRDADQHLIEVVTFVVQP